MQNQPGFFSASNPRFVANMDYFPQFQPIHHNHNQHGQEWTFSNQHTYDAAPATIYPTFHQTHMSQQTYALSENRTGTQQNTPARAYYSQPTTLPGVSNNGYVTGMQNIRPSYNGFYTPQVTQRQHTGSMHHTLQNNGIGPQFGPAQQQWIGGSQLQQHTSQQHVPRQNWAVPEQSSTPQNSSRLSYSREKQERIRLYQQNAILQQTLQQYDETQQVQQQQQVSPAAASSFTRSSPASTSLASISLASTSPSAELVGSFKIHENEPIVISDDEDEEPESNSKVVSELTSTEQPANVRKCRKMPVWAMANASEGLRRAIDPINRSPEQKVEEDEKRREYRREAKRLSFQQQLESESKQKQKLKQKKAAAIAASKPSKKRKLSGSQPEQEKKAPARKKRASPPDVLVVAATSPPNDEVSKENATAATLEGHAAAASTIEPLQDLEDLLLEELDQEDAPPAPGALLPTPSLDTAVSSEDDLDDLFSYDDDELTEITPPTTLQSDTSADALSANTYETDVEAEDDDYMALEAALAAEMEPPTIHADTRVEDSDDDDDNALEEALAAEMEIPTASTNIYVEYESEESEESEEE